MLGLVILEVLRNVSNRIGAALFLSSRKAGEDDLPKRL